MTRTNRTLPVGLVALFVAVSGFCSLVYQVVWERTVRYNFGGDSVSAAIVTGTFLLGLGIGAAVFGRWHRRAFTLFALVQLAIGVYAIGSYSVLAPLARTLGWLFDHSAFDADGVRVTVVVACVVFLLPPCVLIGGSTPLMFNCFIGPGRYSSATVGWLYGVNTAGAALGVLAAPFVFLNRLSLPATLTLVGSGNLLLAVGIWLAGRRLAPPVEGGPSGEAPRAGDDRFLWFLAFASGLVALAFEVSLLRAFFTLNPSSAYNFPAVLMPYLLSMALGSILLTRFRAYTPQAALRRVGALFVAAVIVMMLGVILSAAVSLSGAQATVRQQSTLLLLALYAALLAFPMPFLLSGVFPLLLRLAASTGHALPRKTGAIYFANSVGAFTGALLTQFVGFPLLGTHGVLTVLFLVGILAGSWCLMMAAADRARILLYGALVPAMAVAVLVVPLAVWDTYTFGVTGPDADRVEGASGVAVIRWRAGGGRVYVNGQYMSSLPDDVRHVQLVSFALSLPRRENVLVLGLGGGGIVRELVRDPAVARVDVVDWSQELPRLLESPRARMMLAGTMQSPKVRLCRCDARVAVSLYGSGIFDVVIDDLAEANWVGATSIKSQPYFQQIRRVLKPSGVFVYRGNYGTAREPILAGLAASFPVVREHERGVVLCANGPIAIDRRRAEEVLAARRELLGIPTTRYADWLVDRMQPVPPNVVGRVAPIRDDLLIYEYEFDPFGRLLPTLGRDSRGDGA